MYPETLVRNTWRPSESQHMRDNGQRCLPACLAKKSRKPPKKKWGVRKERKKGEKKKGRKKKGAKEGGKACSRSTATGLWKNSMSTHGLFDRRSLLYCAAGYEWYKFQLGIDYWACPALFPQWWASLCTVTWRPWQKKISRSCDSQRIGWFIFQVSFHKFVHNYKAPFPQ